MLLILDDPPPKEGAGPLPDLVLRWGAEVFMRHGVWCSWATERGGAMNTELVKFRAVMMAIAEDARRLSAALDEATAEDDGDAEDKAAVAADGGRCFYCGCDLSDALWYMTDTSVCGRCAKRIVDAAVKSGRNVDEAGDDLAWHAAAIDIGKLRRKLEAEQRDNDALRLAVTKADGALQVERRRLAKVTDGGDDVEPTQELKRAIMQRNNERGRAESLDKDNARLVRELTDERMVAVELRRRLAAAVVDLSALVQPTAPWDDVAACSECGDPLDRPTGTPCCSNCVDHRARGGL